MISKEEKRQRDRIMALETENSDLKSALVDFHVSITALQMRTTETIRMLKNSTGSDGSGSDYLQ